jgi:hypothetical protein
MRVMSEDATGSVMMSDHCDTCGADGKVGQSIGVLWAVKYYHQNNKDHWKMHEWPYLSETDEGFHGVNGIFMPKDGRQHGYRRTRIAAQRAFVARQKAEAAKHTDQARKALALAVADAAEVWFSEAQARSPESCDE